MITKNKIIALLGLTAILSCNKEEIEVVKNLDTDTNPSKDLVDKDIRTRLGYDPRFYYASFATKEVEMPIMTIGTLEIDRDVVGAIAVTFDKPLDKETTITLEYDASVFDKVKDNYNGYSIGNQSLITFSSVEKVIPKGESVASFEFKMPNRGTEKLLVPYTFKVKGNETAQVEEDKNYFVAKVYPKEVSYTLSSSSVSSAVPRYFLDANGRISRVINQNVEVSVRATDAVPADISIGLVRDEAYTADSGTILAPAGIEGTINRVDFKNLTQGSFSFTLQNSVPLELGIYQIALKVVVYANGVAYEVPQNLFVLPITVERDVNVIGIDEDHSWYNYMDYMFRVDKSSITYQTIGFTSVTNPRNMFDDDRDTFARFRSTRWSGAQLGFKFDSPKRIMGIRIKMTQTQATSQIRVRTSTDEDFVASKATNQGIAEFELGKEGYAILFDNVEEVRWIVLDQFLREGGNGWFQIEEIEFIEE